MDRNFHVRLPETLKEREREKGSRKSGRRFIAAIRTRSDAYYRINSSSSFRRNETKRRGEERSVCIDNMWGERNGQEEGARRGWRVE